MVCFVSQVNFTSERKKERKRGCVRNQATNQTSYTTEKTETDRCKKRRPPDSKSGMHHRNAPSIHPSILPSIYQETWPLKLERSQHRLFNLTEAWHACTFRIEKETKWYLVCMLKLVSHVKLPFYCTVPYCTVLYSACPSSWLLSKLQRIFTSHNAAHRSHLISSHRHPHLIQ